MQNISCLLCDKPGALEIAIGNNKGLICRDCAKLKKSVADWDIFLSKFNMMDEPQPKPVAEIAPNQLQQQPLSLGEETVSKSAAAVEVRRQALQTFVTALSGIFLIFLSTFMASINLIYGVAIAGISTMFFAFYCYKSISKIMYLNKKYGIKR